MHEYFIEYIDFAHILWYNEYNENEGDDYMASTNVTIRMDTEIKKEAEELFNDLGLNLTSAINMFIRKAIAEQGIPFDVKKTVNYNNETIQAMLEADKIAHDNNIKGMTDV